MRDVTREATSVLDIWPYVAAVPHAELWGHSIVPETVDRVYRRGDGLFDHVLVVTRTKSVFLVVIVEVPADRIFGHHLLDLNEEFGLKTPQ